MQLLNKMRLFGDHFISAHKPFFSILHHLKNNFCGTSLVAQWLRIRLPVQGTRAPSLVQEDPTCRGATKPMRHNY